jgi:hypothetical protein
MLALIFFYYFQKDLSSLVKDLEPGNPEDGAPIPYVSIFLVRIW